MGLFYSSSAKEDAERLKHVLIADKHFNPSQIKQVIKSDFFHILKNYAKVSSDDIYIDIEVNQDGSYHLKLDAIAKDLKIFGALPDDYS